MSQQLPARKLPSLLVDPAEETVRRRCRDPINVEGLLVSPGDGLCWERRSPGAARGGAGAALRSGSRFTSAGKPDPPPSGSWVFPEPGSQREHPVSLAPQLPVLCSERCWRKLPNFAFSASPGPSRISATYLCLSSPSSPILLLGCSHLKPRTTLPPLPHRLPLRQIQEGRAPSLRKVSFLSSCFRLDAVCSSWFSEALMSP